MRLGRRHQALSAWMARDPATVIRDFQPRLEVNLSLYRPWGVITSKIAEYNLDKALFKGDDSSQPAR